MRKTNKTPILKEVILPKKDILSEKVILTQQTMDMRKEKVLQKMKENHLDVLIIYADLEHGSNFEYLSGFLPRFEEGLLVLHKNGELYYLLGNENLKLANHARLKGELIHVPQFSLPNQPMYDSTPLSTLLKKANITASQRIGIVGWKLFTSSVEDNTTLFDVPHFVIQALDTIQSNYVNATSLFIGEDGVRLTNNANEILHYSYGARLASIAILQAMDAIALHKSEMDIASTLELYGQPKSVVTIVGSGMRFENANLYPTSKPLKEGDSLSFTVGYKGGLQSRCGIVSEFDETNDNHINYLESVVKPYFKAVSTWIENIKIGMSGHDLYTLVDDVLPKKKYGWSLNPGHFSANEEWVSSCVYENAKEILKSGMLFQIDIIPSIPGYCGTSCECTVALVDEKLKKELTQLDSNFIKHCEENKQYLKEQLGIAVSEDVLVLTCATLFLTPFLLSKNLAMTMTSD